MKIARRINIHKIPTLNFIHTYIKSFQKILVDNRVTENRLVSKCLPEVVMPPQFVTRFYGNQMVTPKVLLKFLFCTSQTMCL